MFLTVFSKPVVCCVFLFDNATVNEKYNCIKQSGGKSSKSVLLLGLVVLVFFFNAKSCLFILLQIVMCEDGCWSPADGPEIALYV